MPSFELTPWLHSIAIGVGFALLAGICYSSATSMGSIRRSGESLGQEDACKLDRSKNEKVCAVSTKKMTTRGDTNPNAVLKWINDNCIKMESTDTKEAKQVVEKVRNHILLTLYINLKSHLFTYLVYQTNFDRLDEDY